MSRGFLTALLLGLMICGQSSVAAETVCPSLPTQVQGTLKVVNYRVYTDPATGDSKVEALPKAAKDIPLLKTGKILTEFDFGAASKIKLVIGPPNLDLPLHPAPLVESFLLLAGSVTMQLADGTKVEQMPGDMLTFEDVNSKLGHGGRTGPCGYVALDIVP